MIKRLLSLKPAISQTPAFLLFVLFLHANQSFSQNRHQLDLTHHSWTIRLDTAAQWQDDELFTPPVDISKLPVNLPTGGWEGLVQLPGKTVQLPASVEQYFWDRNGSTYGVDGNYVGVSWFSTTVDVPDNYEEKRIVLAFEGVRLRAEVFVNHQLAGYDLINGTPFQVDVSSVLQPGQKNQIDVRITDPNGNFNWKDSQTFYWGNYLIVPSHGFGGINGKVELIATDKNFIDDVFVKNKPQMNEVGVQITTVNKTTASEAGKLELEVREHGKSQIVYTKSYSVKVPQDTTVFNYNIKLPNAKLWSVDHPNLYDLSVKWEGNKTSDEFDLRFGFRWFEIKTVNGDKQFYLNNKRIVIRTAISWGFWPANGIMPSDSMAKKQILIAKKLGLNMLNFHRQIGQTNTLDYADELGLLYFEEPGGNKYPGNRYNPTDPLGKMQTNFYFNMRNDRLLRMIKRDRSHPSLIIYNLHNERGEFPMAQDSFEMRMAHQLDETRIITYNSSNGANPIHEHNARFKLHMLPYDQNFYDYGWWDQHHAGGPGVYHDNLYNDPDHYHRMGNHKDEIIYWGEEGAIGTPPRLQLIRDDILNNKISKDWWQSDDYLKWYDAYNSFLKKNDFTKAFPTVDDLTKAMGNVAYYYQGRIIENIRMDNLVDGYAINGWEGIKLENHSGVVDNYRNPKGDVELISKYNQPVYVAVKIRDKVLPTHDTVTVDFFLVNEVNLHGNYQLEISVVDQQNNQGFSTNQRVKIVGGSTYGQLLTENIQFPVKEAGYTTVKAKLVKNGKVDATGSDQLFAVTFAPPQHLAQGMIADTTSVLKNFLNHSGIDNFESYQGGFPTGDWILVGAFDPPKNQFGAGMSNIMEWVYSGHTLIIVNDADKWADFLSNKEVLDYRGAQMLGKSWFGGNFFVKDNPYFENLPVNCAFNWEYQCLATYNKKRMGLRTFSGETMVGCVSDHKKEVYSAFTVIPAGQGKVILTSLDFFSCLKDSKAPDTPIDIEGLNASRGTYNTSLTNKANVVGQQLLLNILKNYNK